MLIHRLPTVLQQIVYNYMSDDDLVCYAIGTPKSRDAALRAVRNPNKALYVACAAGNVDVARKLITLGATNYGKALEYAVHADAIEIIDLLFELGADNYDEAASNVASLTALRALLSNDMQCMDSCVVNLALVGNCSALQWIIDRDIQFISQHVIDAACRTTQYDVLRLLLEHDVTHVQTCFSAACESGQLRIVQLFEKHGANNWNGCLEAACRGGSLDVVQYVVHHSDNPDWNAGMAGALCCTSSTQAELMRMLMYDHGATVEPYGDIRLTSLETVEVLIAHNFDQFAVHQIEAEPHVAMQIALRIRQFCDDNFVNDCLRLASFRGDRTMIEWCLAQDVKLDWTDVSSYIYTDPEYSDLLDIILTEHLELEVLNDIMSAACEGGDYDLVQRLIALGANDFNGGLRHACIEYHTRIINLMIDHGASDFDAACEQAVYGWHPELIKRLVQLGAKITDRMLSHASDRRYRFLANLHDAPLVE